MVVLIELRGEVFIGPRGSSCEGVKLRETLFMAEARWGLVAVCSYVSCAFFSLFLVFLVFLFVSASGGIGGACKCFFLGCFLSNKT